jgi:hypothetical protein
MLRAAWKASGAKVDLSGSSSHSGAASFAQVSSAHPEATMETLTRKAFLKISLLLAGGGLSVLGGAPACGLDPDERLPPGGDGGEDPDGGSGTADGGDGQQDGGHEADGGTDRDAGWEEPPPDAGVTNQCLNGARHRTITQNTGHALVVPAEDVAAGIQTTYGIRGSSPHNHNVTITAAQFAILRAGGTFTVTSTRDSLHSHDVTVECA